MVSASYVRRGDNFIPVGCMIMSYDPFWGIWFPDDVDLGLYDWEVDFCAPIEWSDNGAGGEFGYFDAKGNWVPHNGPMTTHYRTACWDEESGSYVPIKPQIVRISVCVDDSVDGHLADDLPQWSSPENDGYFTVWEFWINDGAYGWVPSLDSELTFVAWIEPVVDHNGQSMASQIIFSLSTSAEPGYCMNATRVNGQWDDTVGSDLKFHLNQPDPRVVRWDETTAGTWIPVTSAVVKVICLDYGAHSGSLISLATIAGKSEMARLNRDIHNPSWVIELGIAFYYAPIPWDLDRNFISDFAGRYDWYYPDEDPDNAPPGDGTIGDGFSAYEEYRGVVVDGPGSGSKHVRLDPIVKEMFVLLNPTEFDSAEFFPNPNEYMPEVYLLYAHLDRTDDKQRVNYNVNWKDESYSKRHIKDVYAPALMDGGESQEFYGLTTGPIWQPYPVCIIFKQSIDTDVRNQNINLLRHTFDEVLKYTIGHELGHTVLWHQPRKGHHDDDLTAFGSGHDEHCLMWPTVPWWLGHYASICFLPRQFCIYTPNLRNPNCKELWKLVE